MNVFLLVRREEENIRLLKERSIVNRTTTISGAATSVRVTKITGARGVSAKYESRQSCIGYLFIHGGALRFSNRSGGNVQATARRLVTRTGTNRRRSEPKNRVTYLFK